MLTGLQRFWQDEAGATTLDYAILLFGVALAGAFAWEKLGSTVGSSVGRAGEELAGGQDELWRQAASAGQVP